MAESEDAGGTTATTGREQQRATPAAKIRVPNLSRFYRNKLPAITPGDFTFHLDLLRPGMPAFPLDKMVDTFGWVDEQSVLTGNFSAFRPDPKDPRTLPIARGHLVRCRVTWDGPSYQLWTMRCDAPQVQSELGQVQVTLQDDMALLDSGSDDWFFRKTKHRPHGYTCDEVTVEVARRLGVKIDKLSKGTTRFALVKRRASGLDVIRAAYAQEKAASGRAFVIRMRTGKLQVQPLTRNPILYQLAGQIQTALITQKAGRKVPTTMLEGRGHIGTGKGTKPVSYTESDRSVMAVYGRVHQVKQYGRVTSHADLRAQVKRDYAAGLRVNDVVTITHQGIPFIERGDGVQIQLPWEGYKGAQSFAYATRCNHTVQAGVYTTDWDFTLVDPILAELEAEAKAAAARAAKGTTAALPTTSGSGQRWLVTASEESLGGMGACRAIQADGYSELSTVPMGVSSDFAALGHIPCLTPMKITNPANGQSTVAVKQDVGAGSSFLPVMGLYPGTLAAIGLGNQGEYSVIIERVDGVPLAPARGRKL